jgi:outer membrane protein insertion porin family
MRWSFFASLVIGFAQTTATGFGQGNSGALFISNSPAAHESRILGENQESGIRILEIEYSSRRSDIAINEDKIRSNIKSKKGGVFSINIVDEDIKHLYQTGDFQNVQIHASEMRGEDGERGVRLSVFVDPKVRVAGVDVKRRREDGALDDLLALKKADLLNLHVKEPEKSSEKNSHSKTPNQQAYKLTQSGDILSSEKLHWDARKMEKVYKEKGYCDVRIDVKEEYLKDGMGKVTFEIHEGNRGFIKKVRFLGNHEVSEKELLKVINLKPNDFMGMGAQSDRFDEITLKDDIEQIKNLYLNHGFIDVSVRASIDIRNPTQNEPSSKSQSILTPNAKNIDLILCYRIEEGQRYGVARISVSGNSFFSEADILKELRNQSKEVKIFDPISLKFIPSDGITRGRAFSVNGLQASIETLQNMYGRAGFREVRVEWNTEPSEKKGELDVHFKILEGERFYVDKVIICGNILTKDEVIRREILLKPGDVFDTELERGSKKNLERLNLFSSISTWAEETDSPNQQKLIFSVLEKPENITFGAGLSFFWSERTNQELFRISFFPAIIIVTGPKQFADWKGNLMKSIFRSGIEEKPLKKSDLQVE